METTLQTRIHFGKARFNQAGKRTTIKSTCPENGVLGNLLDCAPQPEELTENPTFRALQRITSGLPVMSKDYFRVARHLLNGEALEFRAAGAGRGAFFGLQRGRFSVLRFRHTTRNRRRASRNPARRGRASENRQD